MDVSAIIVIVVAAALVFEFTNGFQDTANAIATSIYTRAMGATQAILLAAVMNFFGALASERVAKTITSGLIGVEIAEYVVLAALIAGIFWNIFATYLGIPSSCSHALIGGLIGASVVYYASVNAVLWDGVLQKIIIPIIVSPVLGFFAAFAIMKLVNNVFHYLSYGRANSIFGRLQIISAAFVAFAHGNNDAQKTMGIITLALITGEILPADSGVPLWVKVTCALTMAAGTAMGGRKIIKTMGGGVTKLQPPGGFSAQTAAAAVIEFMTFLGAPISTTHVITSAVMGVGSAKRISAVKWGKAKDIVITWIVTLPACALIGGGLSWLLGMILHA
jgi:PiT family inorganic phosphate transporter